MKPLDPETTRTEYDMSLLWARQFPARFVEALCNYQKENPASIWNHQIDLSRPGFITLIATRKSS